MATDCLADESGVETAEAGREEVHESTEAAAGDMLICSDS